jgi:mannosyl-3-phosphoglycerate phosphatase
MQRVSRVIVFTDLDGSLLDHDTYSFDPAVRTLEKLKDAGIPVIFAGSRTRIEIEWLQHKTGICGPFIAENGAAVFVPDGCFHFSFESSREAGGYRVLEFGWPYPEVVDALRETVAKLGVRVLAFSDLSASEVADLCGLPLWQAQMAKRREYDEPFRVLDPSPAAKSRLLRHLRVRGLHSIRTERFDHLTGVVDKGLAVATLRSWYERELNGRVLTIGLGDSLNDLPLLQQVDLPFIVQNSAAEATARLLRKVPTARVTEGHGPAGWAEAVDEGLAVLSATTTPTEGGPQLVV